MRLLLCIQSWFNNLSKTFASIGRILLLTKFKQLLKAKYEKKNACLLLGNGPSLNQTIEKHSIESFRKFDLMAVNQFANTEYFTALQPKLYLLNAVSYFQTEESLSPFYQELRKELFSNLLASTSWEMYLIVPFRAKKSSHFNALIAGNHNIKAIYFNQTPGEGFPCFTNFVYRKAWAIPRPHNVLIPGIMNAIYLEYKTIALVGADHSWLGEISVNDNNEALVHQKHYYDVDTSRPEKVQDYITRPRNLHEIVHKFYLSFKGYWDILKYSKKRKVSIYNCSEVSMIDAFERKTLTDLLGSQS
jgi:hypothetical protein